MANQTFTIYPQRKNQAALDRMLVVLEENGIPFNTLFNAILPNLSDVVCTHNFAANGTVLDLNLGTIDVK